MEAEAIRCQICGEPMRDVPVWSEAYRKHKEGKPAIWICPACQSRVRGEALDQTGIKKPPAP